jgi:hypothetical protein
MLADIIIRAIAIARVRGCGWWLIGAFWGTLFHIAVAPVQWAMEKGHIVGRNIGYQMDRKPPGPQKKIWKPKGSTRKTRASRQRPDGRSTTWTGWSTGRTNFSTGIRTLASILYRAIK